MMGLQTYDWTLTLAWTAGGQLGIRHSHGQVEAPPGTMEEHIRDGLVGQALRQIPREARGEAVVEDFTLTRDGVGRKYYECGFCWAWTGVEQDGPFAGNMVDHRDDQTNSHCGGSHLPPSGPSRNWIDGYAPLNLPKTASA